MYTDPYEVLGVSRDATTDEIKKAYRRLSRKYHPDANINNPNAAQAEEKFKDIQRAYQQIMDEKEHGGQSNGSNGYGPGSSRGYQGYGGYNGGYGNQQQNGSQTDWDDWFGGFGSFGGFGGGYWQQNQQSQQNRPNVDPHLQAAANYINNRQYQQAINVLNGIQNKTAYWYYLSAHANRGIGNTITALEHAKQAVAMEPSNYQYKALLDQLQNGGQWYQNMGSQQGSSSDMGDWCCKLMLLNIFCNCCCF